MASPRKLINYGVAAVSLLGAWRAFQQSGSKIGKVRSLLSLLAAIAAVVGLVQANQRPRRQSRVA